MRPTHIHSLLKAALWLRAVVPAKDLEMAISPWQNDIQIYETASSTKISVTHLEEMCPEPLKKHLRGCSPEKLASYELMRAEISEWAAEE